ncbi:uncharacterized protein BDR25DRAFT_278770 [Lindgomyces ingoldianus]|uniref:Uncharacterized protein n=1 Tax=Lindgomyces ingoldianus TaxID=673940 RepID=A0ACB6RCF4_9PLEO|nr:uncharacterized protein BDR25DRAFT_278770 [Lindgomyces ingoldianus]KAF2476015.1 hypothetical protein BDR25DRAFT_278770 [Lindgomyces ingoldianus]
MDEPSAQLHLEIRERVVRALATRRPLLHHLNADTSWLLQIPRPASAIRHGSRIYYNILIDPWFVGGQSDVARWFSQQWHATESAVKTVAEVEALAQQIEIFTGGLRLGKGRVTKKEAAADIETFIDAVAISHEFTDHCHKETLLELHKDIPVFATEKAASLISSFKHFRSIVAIPTFTSDLPDWRSYSLAPLPTWLSISRLTASNDALYYHSALLIAFATHPFLPSTPRKRTSASMFPDPSAESSGPDAAECVIYTPHGIPHASLVPIELADPPLHTLAFLHGLHDVSIAAAQQLNLGAKNGLLAQRALRAKYWVGTHDEVKTGGGLVGWFLRRKIWTLEDALRDVSPEVNDKDIDMEDVRFEEIGNGQSRVLE